MGLFSSKKKGVKCEPQPDGTQKCRVYKAAKGQKLATGSEFGFALDSDCNLQFPGGTDIREDDEELVKHVLSEAQNACRKGISTEDV